MKGLFYLSIAIANAIPCINLFITASKSDDEVFSGIAYCVAAVSAIFAIFFTVKAAIYKPENDEQQ